MEKEKEVLEKKVQEFNFNIKGTKAMGKAGFIKSWKEQKERYAPKGKGRYGRFDPEKAWDELFPVKK